MTALKTLDYLKIDKLLEGVKIDHFAKAIVRQNVPLWNELQNAKTNQRKALQEDQTCSMQKEGRKNSCS